MSGQGKSWKDLSFAAVSPKPSTEFLTGDWKTYMPMCDSVKCVSCLTCVMLCPEGAICWKSDVGKLEFNINFCKGCGICANVCPAKAIVMNLPEKEE